jgi:CO dehydrogenase maturation factor
VSKVIAVAGKGGTGKTTLCGLLIKYLGENNKDNILAVDADPNSNLNEVLGVRLPMTLGDIREDTLKQAGENGLPAGMSKQEYMKFMFGDALAEEDSYDLLVMGRTQGQGCYCFINNILSEQINKYSGNYSYIVVDNEAGLEHVSRGTLPNIDIMLLVSDPSRRGIQAAGRVKEIVDHLEQKPGMVKLIVNRAPDGKLSDGVLEEINNRKLELLGVLPNDEIIYEYDSEGKPSSDIPDDSPIKIQLQNIIKKLNLNKSES